MMIFIGILLWCGVQASPSDFLLSRRLMTGCIIGGDAFNMSIVYPENRTIMVPKIPDGGSAYSYATENALVAVPKACATEFASKIKKKTALDDRNGPTGGVYFYIADLEGGYTTLKLMNKCSCGLVIEAHGSGGPGWSSAMYSAVLAGMGLITVTPNSMAMPKSMGLKGRLPLKPIDKIDTTNFCGSYNAFDGECVNFNSSSPYCYTTKEENILLDSDTYRRYVEGVYKIRERELDYFMENQANLLSAFKSLYFLGNSEGGMVASRYHHAKLDAALSGRIISAFSCDFNYFMSCSDHAKICGDRCKKTVPQLNLIGDKDSYFSAVSSSMSSKISNSTQGYGGPITGNCRAQYVAQKFTKWTSVVFTDAGHGPNYYNENIVRSVLADFLADNKKEEWKSLKSCTLSSGVYTCPPDGPVTCKTVNNKYQVNPSATFNAISSYACPNDSSFAGKVPVNPSAFVVVYLAVAMILMK